MHSKILIFGALAVAMLIVSIMAGACGDEFWSQWDGVLAIANAMACVAEIAWPSST